MSEYCVYYHKKYYKSNSTKSKLERRIYDAKRLFGLSYKQYIKITKRCAIHGCRTVLVMDIHHVDGDKSNCKLKNLLGLCPTHHQIIHRLGYDVKPIKNSKCWLLVKPDKPYRRDEYGKKLYE
jgi:hypothetical protein